MVAIKIQFSVTKYSPIMCVVNRVSLRSFSQNRNNKKTITDDETANFSIPTYCLVSCVRSMYLSGGTIVPNESSLMSKSCTTRAVPI